MKTQTTLLEDVETPFGRIKITRSEKTGSHTYYQGKCFHSQSDAEGVSTCVYIHVMYEIVRQSAAKRVLMIGCAGGSLATMLQRLGCQVTLVDINEYSFTLAKRYFQLPAEVECVTADGMEFVRGVKKPFDAVVIDVFDSKGKIPEPFLADGFFHSLRAAVKPGGIAVMNVMIAHDMDMQAERIATAMQSAGLPAVLFDWRGIKNRNTIVAGGRVEGIHIPSGKEPFWIKPDLKGLSRRQAKQS
jgi:spermidine synthase